MEDYFVDIILTASFKILVFPHANAFQIALTEKISENCMNFKIRKTWLT